MLQAHAIRAAVLSPAISRHSSTCTSSRRSKARSEPLAGDQPLDRRRQGSGPPRPHRAARLEQDVLRQGQQCVAEAQDRFGPTPKTVQAVGRCRRSMSPSMMSSCSKEKLCTSSTATAVRAGGGAARAWRPAPSPTAAPALAAAPCPRCRRGAVRLPVSVGNAFRDGTRPRPAFPGSAGRPRPRSPARRGHGPSARPAGMVTVMTRPTRTHRGSRHSLSRSAVLPTWSSLSLAGAAAVRPARVISAPCAAVCVRFARHPPLCPASRCRSMHRPAQVPAPRLRRRVAGNQHLVRAGTSPDVPL